MSMTMERLSVEDAVYDTLTRFSLNGANLALGLQPEVLTSMLGDLYGEKEILGAIGTLVQKNKIQKRDVPFRGSWQAEYTIKPVLRPILISAKAVKGVLEKYSTGDTKYFNTRGPRIELIESELGPEGYSPADIRNGLKFLRDTSEITVSEVTDSTKETYKQYILLTPEQKRLKKL